jgi:tetratricopeptide (TPR) repeat protein
MSTGYEIAHISSFETKVPPTGRLWAPVREHFGISAFGVNAWTAEEPGQGLINEHDEAGPRDPGHEELYVVVAGHAQFTVDGDEINAPAGTFVFVRDPAVKRKATAKEGRTTVIAAGGPRGAPYKATGWERSAIALRHWDTKDWEAAIAELSELRERHRDDATILYNLACAESLGGRPDDALAHLEQAVGLDAQFAKLAADDGDFDAIRGDERFSAVTGQTDAGGTGS